MSCKDQMLKDTLRPHQTLKIGGQVSCLPSPRLAVQPGEPSDPARWRRIVAGEGGMSSWKQCREWRGTDWLRIGELLGDRPEGAKETDAEGSIPLHLAAASGAPAQAVRALIAAFPRGLTKRDADGLLPLHLVSSSFSNSESGGATTEAFEAILEAHPDSAREKDSLFGRLPLHAAVEHLAPLDVILSLLDAYPEGASARDLDGNLPIHLAVESHAHRDVWKALGQAHPQGIYAKGRGGKVPSRPSASASMQEEASLAKPSVSLPPIAVTEQLSPSTGRPRGRAAASQRVSRKTSTTPSPKAPQPQQQSMSPSAHGAAASACLSEALEVEGLLRLMSDMLISTSDIQVSSKMLGQGAFGTVYLAQWKGKPVAAKQLLGESDEELRASAKFLAEARITHRLRHPNVVQVHGAVKQPLSIVMEYMQGGSLFDLLHKSQKGKNLDLGCRLRMGLDIARGMEHMHSQQPPVLHRDLKTHNILLASTNNNGSTSSLTLKVADFGLAKQTAQAYLQGTSSLTGTPMYMAPEVWGGKLVNSMAADLYSFAVVFWELLSGCKPWADMMWVQVMHQVVNENKRPEDANPDAMPYFTPVPIRRLIEKCWCQNPIQRPSFQEVVRTIEAAIEDMEAQ